VNGEGIRKCRNQRFDNEKEGKKALVHWCSFLDTDRRRRLENKGVLLVHCDVSDDGTLGNQRGPWLAICHEPMMAYCF